MEKVELPTVDRDEVAKHRRGQEEMLHLIASVQQSIEDLRFGRATCTGDAEEAVVASTVRPPQPPQPPQPTQQPSSSSTQQPSASSALPPIPLEPLRPAVEIAARRHRENSDGRSVSPGETEDEEASVVDIDDDIEGPPEIDSDVSSEGDHRFLEFSQHDFPDMFHAGDDDFRMASATHAHEMAVQLMDSFTVFQRVRLQAEINGWFIARFHGSEADINQAGSKEEEVGNSGREFTQAVGELQDRFAARELDQLCKLNNFIRNVRKARHGEDRKPAKKKKKKGDQRSSIQFAQSNVDDLGDAVDSMKSRINMLREGTATTEMLDSNAPQTSDLLEIIADQQQEVAELQTKMMLMQERIEAYDGCVKLVKLEQRKSKSSTGDHLPFALRRKDTSRMSMFATKGISAEEIMRMIDEARDTVSQEVLNERTLGNPQLLSDLMDKADPGSGSEAVRLQKEAEDLVLECEDLQRAIAHLKELRDDESITQTLSRRVTAEVKVVYDPEAFWKSVDLSGMKEDEKHPKDEKGRKTTVKDAGVKSEVQVAEISHLLTDAHAMLTTLNEQRDRIQQQIKDAAVKARAEDKQKRDDAYAFAQALDSKKTMKKSAAVVAVAKRPNDSTVGVAQAGGAGSESDQEHGSRQKPATIEFGFGTVEAGGNQAEASHGMQPPELATAGNEQLAEDAASQEPSSPNSPKTPKKSKKAGKGQKAQKAEPATASGSTEAEGNSDARAVESDRPSVEISTSQKATHGGVSASGAGTGDSGASADSVGAVAGVGAAGAAVGPGGGAQPVAKAGVPVDSDSDSEDEVAGAVMCSVNSDALDASEAKVASLKEQSSLLLSETAELEERIRELEESSDSDDSEASGSASGSASASASASGRTGTAASSRRGGGDSAAEDGSVLSDIGETADGQAEGEKADASSSESKELKAEGEELQAEEEQVQLDEDQQAELNQARQIKEALQSEVESLREQLSAMMSPDMSLSPVARQARRPRRKDKLDGNERTDTNDTTEEKEDSRDISLTFGEFENSSPDCGEENAGEALGGKRGLRPVNTGDNALTPATDDGPESPRSPRRRMSPGNDPASRRGSLGKESTVGAESTVEGESSLGMEAQGLSFLKIVGKAEKNEKNVKLQQDVNEMHAVILESNKAKEELESVEKSLQASKSGGVAQLLKQHSKKPAAAVADDPEAAKRAKVEKEAKEVINRLKHDLKVRQAELKRLRAIWFNKGKLPEEKISSKGESALAEPAIPSHAVSDTGPLILGQGDEIAAPVSNLKRTSRMITQMSRWQRAGQAAMDGSTDFETGVPAKRMSLAQVARGSRAFDLSALSGMMVSASPSGNSDEHEHEHGESSSPPQSRKVTHQRAIRNSMLPITRSGSKDRLAELKGHHLSENSGGDSPEGSERAPTHQSLGSDHNHRRPTFGISAVALRGAGSGAAADAQQPQQAQQPQRLDLFNIAAAAEQQQSFGDAVIGSSAVAGRRSTWKDFYGSNDSNPTNPMLARRASSKNRAHQTTPSESGRDGSQTSMSIFGHTPETEQREFAGEEAITATRWNKTRKTVNLALTAIGGMQKGAAGDSSSSSARPQGMAGDTSFVVKPQGMAGAGPLVVKPQGVAGDSPLAVTVSSRRSVVPELFTDSDFFQAAKSPRQGSNTERSQVLPKGPGMQRASIRGPARPEQGLHVGQKPQGMRRYFQNVKTALKIRH